jgi:3'(2'),5'-bisphosphate nucleotidase
MIEDREALTHGLVAAAVDAAGVIMGHYENDIEIMEKGDRSPVTQADHEAEAILLAALSQLAPGVPVVAEEEVAAGRVPQILGDQFFLVDPLDGTKEFLKRNGQFTVNIGLIEKGVPTLGVVYAPALSTMYFGYAPGKAFQQQIDPHKGRDAIGENAPTPIAARAQPADGVVAVSSGSHKHEAVEEFLARFTVTDHKEMGSSLKFCLIATGEADIYPRQPQSSCEWDVAAAHAVLRAAGGEVTQLDGTPFDYGHAERKFLNPGFVARGRES